MDINFMTIKNSVEVTEYIEKSKFISHAFPIESEKEAMEKIHGIKKIHYKATHNVYAYVLGQYQEIQKSTDDGEPSGTAGVPILEIIKKENLTNILIVVTRYFGGVKLGAGGLIRAYAHMAKLALMQSEKILHILCDKIRISMNYSYWGKFENYISNNKNIYLSSVDFFDQVTIHIYVLEKNKANIINHVNEITSGNATFEQLGKEYIPLTISV